MILISLIAIYFFKERQWKYIFVAFLCYPFTIVFFIYLYLLCNFFCISFIWQQNKPIYIYWLGSNLYLLPHLNTDNYMQSFQYKFLNNVNFLNENLPTFERKSSSLCSLCNLYEKIPFRKFMDVIGLNVHGQTFKIV